MVVSLCRLQVILVLGKLKNEREKTSRSLDVVWLLCNFTKAVKNAFKTETVPLTATFDE